MLENPDELQTMPEDLKTETYLLTTKGLEKLDKSKVLEQPQAIATKKNKKGEDINEVDDDLETKAKPKKINPMELSRNV